jgi:hypothetical protein
MIDYATILRALGRLSEHLGERGVDGELDVVGGTAMMLAFQARQATKDVDAVFLPAQLIRECATQVARELNLPADWLNDAAKRYLSARGEFEQKLVFSHLRVLTPSAEYMLAMKVMAARTGLDGGAGDKEDITFLIRRIGLKDTDEVMAVVERLYERSAIHPRSSFLVEEIIGERSES